MAVRSTSRHRSIPINVVVERRPRTKPAPKAVPATPPTRSAPPALEKWSEAHRRRVMWITVGVGSLAILLIWISVFSAQIRGTTPTFFGDVAKMVRDVKWPWEPKPTTPQEQEIRQLEEQVFPQFQ